VNSRDLETIQRYKLHVERLNRVEVSGAIAYLPRVKEYPTSFTCSAVLRINDQQDERNHIKLYARNGPARELAKLQIGDQCKIYGILRVSQGDSSGGDLEVSVNDVVRIFTVDEVARLEFERLYPRAVKA
jgi:hypothetical protein